MRLWFNWFERRARASIAEKAKQQTVEAAKASLVAAGFRPGFLPGLLGAGLAAAGSGAGAAVAAGSAAAVFFMTCCWLATSWAFISILPSFLASDPLISDASNAPVYLLAVMRQHGGSGKDVETANAKPAPKKKTTAAGLGTNPVNRIAEALERIPAALELEAEAAGKPLPEALSKEDAALRQFLEEYRQGTIDELMGQRKKA